MTCVQNDDRSLSRDTRERPSGHADIFVSPPVARGKGTSNCIPDLFAVTVADENVYGRMQRTRHGLIAQHADRIVYRAMKVQVLTCAAEQQ